MQARKTQYMCMSKLSPKELASRAHHFLNDTGKGKQLPSIADTSLAKEGIILKSVYMYIYIHACIYYMKPETLLSD